MMSTPRLSLLFVLFLFVSSLHATIWYVEVGASGAGTGWGNAYGDLQLAINAAAAGDSIWVGSGTYKATATNPASGNTPAARNVTFYINKDIELYGGFQGNETNLDQRDLKDHPVILSGDLGIALDTSDNAFHVLYIDGANTMISSACIIDGFSIVNGNANKSVPDNVGGGIRIDGSVNIANPTIRNCSFSFNNAQSGGAVFNRGFSGESSPEFINCLFFENSANLGGAVYNGGASGICDPTFTNCTFAQDTATALGSAMVNDGRNGGQCTVTIQNCIIWNNGPQDDIQALDATTLMSYSLLDDGTPDGVILAPGITDQGDNLDSDPLFTNAGTFDFTITACSQAFDAGNDAFNNEPIDICSGFRIREVIDMGAFENTTPVSCPPFGSPLYVDTDQVGCIGTSWALAFDNLQDAIDRACDCPNVEEIWVAEGTYIPTINNPGTGAANDLRDRSIYLSKPIRMYGGFAGTETMLSERDVTAHPTILSGALPSADSVYHIMYLDADSICTDWVIDGFTFEHGRATGAGFLDKKGGALYASSSSSSTPPLVAPTIRHCTFRENKAYNEGGSIYLRASNANDTAKVAPIIQECDFVKNCASSGAGIGIQVVNSDPAIVAPFIDGCRFDSNYVETNGSGLYIFTEEENSTAIKNSHFTNDTSGRGALYMQSEGLERSMISNTFFESNLALGDGGGVYVLADSCTITVSSSTFFRNTANGTGGGMSLEYHGGRSHVRNCLFARNRGAQGGALDVRTNNLTTGEDYRQVTISNSTFTLDSTSGSGGAIFANGDSSFSYSNCIFWDNSAASGTDISRASSSANSDTIRNSILSPGGLSGNFVVQDTLQRDPLFVNAANDDFRLMTGSPAIDSGTVAYVLSSTDLDDKARILGTSVDMGAYEFGDPCSQKNTFLHPSAFVSGASQSFLTNECILGTNLIKSGADITYDADQGVILDKLFSVELGAVFVADVDGCE